MAGYVLLISQILERQELQSINKRFEARQWMVWAPESLKRLDPKLLWDYHEKHEFPRSLAHWDWTLSWLLEHNHPPVQNPIVIFNRTLEDEPPDDAVEAMPWLKPLRSYPLSRKTVAEMVDFLAASGAAAIILDNDFPQHSEGDEEMAAVIHKWAGKPDGKRVPIFMVQTVNSGSDSHMVELGTPTRPVGILNGLSKLEPGVDVEDRYLGTTCVFQDVDQVVRGIFLHREVAGKTYDSIILKLLRSLNKPVPANAPYGEMDIDFACPPKSDLYPTRPLSYLLDPEQKKVLAQGSNPKDVKIRGAVVFLGDGITDVYSTPFTNYGNNQMSGTEILAHALETVSRGSWPTRLSFRESVAYLVAISFLAGAFWVMWKRLQHTVLSKRRRLHNVVVRLFQDLAISGLMLCGVYFLPCVIFNSLGWLVPMVVPTAAVGFGVLAAILLEREQEREERFQMELKAAEEKLVLQEEKYESEIKRREAEARTREALVDKKRRHEFVRRINHDLNAPVSVLNWTVSELQMMDLEEPKANEKVKRLVKSSDKLCELIDQLVQSYDYETVPTESNSAPTSILDVCSIVHDCVDGQVPLATMHGDALSWHKPEDQLWAKANQLELTRVVDNIIRNAIKHNPEGTAVNVSVESNGHFHVISIADNGKGISPENLERIFQPGFRVEPNSKNGQGLGLDIAKTLIEGMGGEIQVTSTVRKGTTFRLKIPISAEEEADEEEHVRDPVPTELSEQPEMAGVTGEHKGKTNGRGDKND